LTVPEPRLVFTGNVIVDLVMTVDAIPEAGGDTVATSSAVSAGGGYNVMVAASRDNLPVVFAGQYGAGLFGQVVRDAIASSGFEIVQTGLDDVDSGYCVALVDSAAERTFVTVAGAESRLTAADLARVKVYPDDLVYVSGYSLAHKVNAASLPPWLESLPGEVRVITDPSPLVGELDRAALDRVLARTDVLSLNVREARLATSLSDMSAAARALVERIRQGGSVIVRDGSNGCLVMSAGVEPIAVPAFPVRAVDTNGAGDAHGGVLAAALSRGDDMRSAARRANAASALAVTRTGPATAPTSNEIDALLAT
jgi:sugar/nucleoside kinase (ribokinase family)